MIDQFINVRLIANPFNWVTVTLMVVIGGMAVELILRNSGAAAKGD